MSSAVELRKGWCPGALRPMESGDGLLLRVRPFAGCLSVVSLATIADCAREFGSGEIDVTNRGNLQLRGLSVTSYRGALAMLDRAGLIDASVDAETVRNVVVDPLSGVDPSRADVRRLAETLSRALGENQIFQRLPAKFGFSLSGCDDPKVGGRAADIMVAARQLPTVVLDGDDGLVATVQADGLAGALERLVQVFLDARASDPTLLRMRDAVSKIGSSRIFADAGLTAMRVQLPSMALPPLPVGELGDADATFGVGIGLPFGRIRAADLSALCAGVPAALKVNVGPQRVLVFAIRDSVQVDALLEKARDIGLIVVPDDPRLTMDVCPGAPACRNATTNTRDDASRLVGQLQDRQPWQSLHISGCEKGCARRAAASLTLVARNGCYDVVRNATTAGRVEIANVAPQNLAAVISRLGGLGAGSQ